MDIRTGSRLGWRRPQSCPIRERKPVFLGFLAAFNPVLDVLLLRGRVSPQCLIFQCEVWEVDVLETQVVGVFLQPDTLLVGPLELLDKTLSATTPNQHRRRGAQEHDTVAVRVGVYAHPTIGVVTLCNVWVKQ